KLRTWSPALIGLRPSAISLQLPEGWGAYGGRFARRRRAPKVSPRLEAAAERRPDPGHSAAAMWAPTFGLRPSAISLQLPEGGGEEGGRCGGRRGGAEVCPRLEAGAEQRADPCHSAAAMCAPTFGLRPSAISLQLPEGWGAYGGRFARRRRAPKVSPRLE